MLSKSGSEKSGSSKGLAYQAKNIMNMEKKAANGLPIGSMIIPSFVCIRKIPLMFRQSDERSVSERFVREISHILTP